ncbi:MAG: threo-3-hydroxy-L-aspartate ammonia-lyase [Sulfurifustis sp.]
MPASVSYDDVAHAAERLAGVAHCTPVLTSATIDRRIGAHVFFKCENLQRAGAFKFRGAYNAIALLDAEQKRRGVVAFSSGNHGQAVALAARLQSVAATIVLPADAPVSKIAAARDYGGTLVFYDRLTENREEIARRIAIDEGRAVIPPYDDPNVIAGQGTAAKELFEQVGALDCLVVCVGGGGLLAGSALAARALAPQCKLIGVEPEAGNDGQRSLRAGRIVTIAVPETIADGARTVHLGKHTFAVIRETVDDIVTVSDRQLVETMRFLAERMKIIVEPTGALAAAAVLQGVIPVMGKRVGVLVSGGNVDVTSFCTLLAG